MGLNPLYALTEFYVSLVTYTVMHMIFVISSDFVDAFNIPPLNIGIYVDKLAAIRALLMVIADILEWGITQKWLHDPGAYSKLSDSKAARRQGSVLSFFIMWACRCHYIWIVYKSDNKSLLAFINLSVEGFWFGVFQMSFFAVGPEYNAFTSLAIHTMGNFIFFTQLILNKLAKKYPGINCLCRVRVHGWICLVISTISLGPWVWFCLDYIKGNTTQFNELVEELQAVSVAGSSSTINANDIATALAKAVEDGGTKFAELVNALNGKQGFQRSSEALTKDSLQNALSNAKTQIAALIQAEFGVNVTPTHINVQGPGGGNKVIVTVKGGNNSGSSVVKQNDNIKINQNIEIEVKLHENLVGSDADKAKEVASKLAERLRKAAEKAKAAAASGDYKPGKELVEVEFGDNASVSALDNKVIVNAGSGSKTKEETVSIVILGSSGGDEFNNLVGQLAVQVPAQISSDSLTATKLKQALDTKEVKQKIANLVMAEFEVSGVSHSNITVTKDVEASGNKVTVTVKNEEDVTGTATVNTGQTITIEVKGGTSDLTNSNKANAIAAALALALVHQKVVVALKKKGVTIALPGTSEVTITVNNAKSNAVARRIARRLAKSVTQAGQVKLGHSKTIWFGVSCQMTGKIDTSNVWSPFLLFIVGAFAEDFAVPGILPFAFLDPEKANLVNYLTPLFFFTGALITLLLNDIFSAEQSLFGTTMKDLDSQFKEWSEGAANGWHGLWALNLLKYTAFFISMFGIHGIFPRLRCIVQCRWRVMLLTMFVVVPRAWLETAGYVGVANFAIAQGETMDFNGFSYIAYHDMLAMFCRFVYGKFVVGYNSTQKELLVRYELLIIIMLLDRVIAPLKNIFTD